MSYPQGILTFPGLGGVRSFSFTLSHGIAPSRAIVELLPGVSNLSTAPGVMSLFFGSSFEVDFPFCVIDQATIKRGADGMVVSLAIMDRRWAWKFGRPINGHYNIRNIDGTIKANEATPQYLATLCFQAMGEQQFDVSLLPNDSRPEVNWAYATPAVELNRLVEDLGCHVVLGLDNVPRIWPLGYGSDLPDTGTQRTVDYGIDPPAIPDSILLVGAPTRYETIFGLQAVGEDTDGSIKPIAKLSYAPAGGFGSEFYTGFSNITNDQSRMLARKSVYKWYGLSTTLNGQIPGSPLDFKAFWQVLPLEDHKVSTYKDPADGIERPDPATVYGYWWDATFDAKNWSKGRAWHKGFSINREKGIVELSEPAAKYTAATNKFSDAQLFLITACSMMDPTYYSWDRWTVSYPVPDGVEGVGPLILHRDDVQRTVITNWTDQGGGNIQSNGLTDNQQQLQQEAQYYIQAALAQFQNVGTGHVEYAGFLPISPDGNIRQVSWSGGPSGAVTRASVNSEFSITVPRYAERKQRWEAEDLERRKHRPTHVGFPANLGKSAFGGGGL